MLLTGPNMSGKTTYIKQVAALQVLAQVNLNMKCVIVIVIKQFSTKNSLPVSHLI